MPAEPTIDYDSLTQEAMRGVVRNVLTQAAKTGLPGDHHFYISFDTAASGVVLSKRLKDKYPHEMTIVLQHRFWDLSVSDEGFEVKLTFDGIPERLVVPFAAIRVFFDPSVRYGLQFEDLNADPEAGDDISQRFGGRRGSNGASRPTLRSTAPKKPRVPRKSKSEKSGAPRMPDAVVPDVEPANAKPAAAKPGDKAPEAKPAPATDQAPPPAAHKFTPAARSPDKPSEDKPRQDNGGAQIVSLDAFRKK